MEQSLRRYYSAISLHSRINSLLFALSCLSLSLTHSSLRLASLSPPSLLTRLIPHQNGVYQGQCLMETTPLSSTSALPPPPPIKQGLGVFVYDNGDFFFGEWDSNRIHGEGMLFFAFGGFVHGFFSSSRLTGPAFLKFADGEVYEGGWVDGKLSGDVYNYFVDESIWLKSHYTQGIFQGIVSEGQGRAPSRILSQLSDSNALSSKHRTRENPRVKVLNFTDGSQFLGCCDSSTPLGLGGVRRISGLCDVGFFKSGTPVNYARLNLPNNRVYDGELREGKFHGKGVVFDRTKNSWVFGDFDCRGGGGGKPKEIQKGRGQYPLAIVSKNRAAKRKADKDYQDIFVSETLFDLPSSKDNFTSTEVRRNPHQIDISRQKIQDLSRCPQLAKSFLSSKQVFEDYSSLQHASRDNSCDGLQEKKRSPSANSRMYSFFKGKENVLLKLPEKKQTASCFVSKFQQEEEEEEEEKEEFIKRGQKKKTNAAARKVKAITTTAANGGSRGGQWQGTREYSLTPNSRNADLSDNIVDHFKGVSMSTYHIPLLSLSSSSLTSSDQVNIATGQWRTPTVCECEETPSSNSPELNTQRKGGEVKKSQQEKPRLRQAEVFPLQREGKADGRRHTLIVSQNYKCVTPVATDDQKSEELNQVFNMRSRELTVPSTTFFKEEDIPTQPLQIQRDEPITSSVDKMKDKFSPTSAIIVNQTDGSGGGGGGGGDSLTRIKQSISSIVLEVSNKTPRISSLSLIPVNTKLTPTHNQSVHSRSVQNIPYYEVEETETVKRKSIVKSTADHQQEQQFGRSTNSLMFSFKEYAPPQIDFTSATAQQRRESSTADLPRIIDAAETKVITQYFPAATSSNIYRIPCVTEEKIAITQTPKSFATSSILTTINVSSNQLIANPLQTNPLQLTFQTQQPVSSGIPAASNVEKKFEVLPSPIKFLRLPSTEYLSQLKDKGGFNSVPSMNDLVSQIYIDDRQHSSSSVTSFTAKADSATRTRLDTSLIQQSHYIPPALSTPKQLQQQQLLKLSEDSLTKAPPPPQTHFNFHNATTPMLLHLNTSSASLSLTPTNKSMMDVRSTILNTSPISNVMKESSVIVPPYYPLTPTGTPLASNLKASIFSTSTVVPSYYPLTPTAVLQANNSTILKPIAGSSPALPAYQPLGLTFTSSCAATNSVSSPNCSSFVSTQVAQPLLLPTRTVAGSYSTATTTPYVKQSIGHPLIKSHSFSSKIGVSLDYHRALNNVSSTASPYHLANSYTAPQTNKTLNFQGSHLAGGSPIRRMQQEITYHTSSPEIIRDHVLRNSLKLSSGIALNKSTCFVSHSPSAKLNRSRESSPFQWEMSPASKPVLVTVRGISPVKIGGNQSPIKMQPQQESLRFSSIQNAHQGVTTYSPIRNFMSKSSFYTEAPSTIHFK